MPDFSRRWGLPSCQEESLRGRRGNAAPCRARLEGWIRNVASRSPIWGYVDLEAFCRKTGYSREHATRELSKIRRKNQDLAFETKLRCKKGRRHKRWGVIVAARKKLRFDQCSLFYDVRGNRLHNRTTLGRGGKRIVPTIESFAPARRPRGRPRKHPVVHAQVKQSPGRPTNPVGPGPDGNSRGFFPVPIKPQCAENDSSENGRLCDIAYKERIPNGIQQKDPYGAGRDMAQWRGSGAAISRGKPRSRLRKKAFALLRRLAGCHWDNCKVTFSKATAYRYALKALADGHEEERIISCYTRSRRTPRRARPSITFCSPIRL